MVYTPEQRATIEEARDSAYRHIESWIVAFLKEQYSGLWNNEPMYPSKTWPQIEERLVEYACWWVDAEAKVLAAFAPTDLTEAFDSGKLSLPEVLDTITKNLRRINLKAPSTAG